MEDADVERGRRESAFDVDRVVALASRVMPAECLSGADALLEASTLSTQQRCRLHLARARALNLTERPSEALRDLTIAHRLIGQAADDV